jgi:hypothetical protein
MPRRTVRDDGNDRRPLRPPLSPATLVLQRWRRRAVCLSFGTYATVFTACAAWPRGAQLSPAASGLVGEWASSRRPRSTDTTLLRFGPDGSAEQLQRGPGHKPREIPFGPFRVYADTGRMRLLCFSLRRGRSQPACRYFQVDTLIDESGRVRRQLHFLDWVAEHGTGPESWTERAP